jgi:hypothetical protein
LSFTPNPDWILFDGFWRDANIWIDDQQWNDSAGRRREVHASASSSNFAIVTGGLNYCIVSPSMPNAAIVSGANEAA